MGKYSSCPHHPSTIAVSGVGTLHVSVIRVTDTLGSHGDPSLWIMWPSSFSLWNPSVLHSLIPGNKGAHSPKLIYEVTVIPVKIPSGVLKEESDKLTLKLIRKRKCARTGKKTWKEKNCRLGDGRRLSVNKTRCEQHQPRVWERPVGMWEYRRHFKLVVKEYISGSQSVARATLRVPKILSGKPQVRTIFLLMPKHYLSVSMLFSLSGFPLEAAGCKTHVLTLIRLGWVLVHFVF